MENAVKNITKALLFRLTFCTPFCLYETKQKIPNAFNYSIHLDHPSNIHRKHIILKDDNFDYMEGIYQNVKFITIIIELLEKFLISCFGEYGLTPKKPPKYIKCYSLIEIASWVILKENIDFEILEMPEELIDVVKNVTFFEKIYFLLLHLEYFVKKTKIEYTIEVEYDPIIRLYIIELNINNKKKNISEVYIYDEIDERQQKYLLFENVHINKT